MILNERTPNFEIGMRRAFFKMDGKEPNNVIKLQEKIDGRTGAMRDLISLKLSSIIKICSIFNYNNKKNFNFNNFKLKSIIRESSLFADTISLVYFH